MKETEVGNAENDSKVDASDSYILPGIIKSRALY